MKSLLMVLWSCFYLTALVSTVDAQTPGSIFAPANAPGDAVLDPNGDGFISQTTAGFSTNDVTESELPFVPMVFLQPEISSDMLTGSKLWFYRFY